MLTVPEPQMAEHLAQKFGYASWDRYAGRASFLFDGVPLSDKQVCDVGCGAGALAVWCALQGATVVGLEPQVHGSADDYYQTFQETLSIAGLTDCVQSRNATMEEFFSTSDSRFDLLILHNVINHLAEDAVQVLPRDAAAQKLFIEKFAIMRSGLHANGMLIVADSARSNFWNRLGLPSPLARTIEWNKHQDPSVWIDLAREAGLALHDLRWSYLHPYRRLTSNCVAQYLTASHFVLRFVAVP